MITCIFRLDLSVKTDALYVGIHLKTRRKHGFSARSFPHAGLSTTEGRRVAPALASRHRRVLVPRSAHEAHCQTLAVRSGRRRQRAGGLPCKCSARALHLHGEPDGGLRRRGRPWNLTGRWKAPIDGAFTPGPGLAGRLHDQRRPSRRRRAHTVERCVCLRFARIHAF